MSANPSGRIPDAWEDDFERQVDVRICYLYPPYHTSLLVERLHRLHKALDID